MSDAAVQTETVELSAPRLPALRLTPMRHNALWLALIVALVHGLLYVVMVPPWQHYDEPSHFEYVWLIAHRQQLPKPDGGDLTLRRELIRSMGQHGFYDDLGGAPNADALASSQLNIGISQLDDPPGYYLWAAAWLWPVRNQSLEAQLVAARLSSLALLLMTVGMSYATVMAVTRAGSPLRWMVPLSMAMLPGFVDLMTAVNNDAGANAAFALVICIGVIIIRRGVSVPRLLLLLIGVAACFWMHRTVSYAAILVPLILVLAWWRPRLRWLCLGLGVGAMVLLAVGFNWGDAAFWYRGTLQTQTTRARSTHPELGLGATALQLSETPSHPQPGLLQMLPHDLFQTLGGKTLTIGGWVWAAHDMTIAAPQVVVAGQGTAVLPAPTLSISAVPQFLAYTVTLPANIDRAWIVLAGINPAPGTSAETSPDSPSQTLSYDGLVMAVGEYPLAAPPHFTDASAQAGTWGEAAFTNLLRNPSAETTWPFMRPVWNVSPELILTREFWPFNLSPMPFDRGGGDWYFRLAADNIFRTFWAKFGWGHVAMSDIWYRVFGMVTLIGSVGACAALMGRRKWLPWKVILFLGLIATLVWSIAWLRGLHSTIYEVFIPGARYGYPALLPVLLVLTAGWQTLAEWVGRPLRRRLSPTSQAWVAALVFGAPLLVIDVAAILKLLEFYANR